MTTAVADQPLRTPTALARRLRPLWRPALEVVAVAALAVLAVALRRPPLGASFWIDEGLSVGIASHPLGDIPHLLRLDGSPPLYYVVLHLWMRAFGDTEHATHLLSLIFAVLAVPAAWWAARPFGAGAGLICGALLALSPFVGLYADETRMYTLVLLLALLATGAFVRAFAYGRRPYAVVLAVLLAALLYTHAWGAFLAAAMGIAWICLLIAGPDRKRLLIDGAIAFGGALVLFAPWVPTLADQTAHTGAPWSHRPSDRSLTNALNRMLSGRTAVRLLLIFGLGLLAIRVWRDGPRQRRGALAVVAIAVLTLMTAWAWSRVQQPAWAFRYLVVVFAPLAVALAAGLGRVPLLGVAVVLVVFATTWHGRPPQHSFERKSNVALVARELRGDLPHGTRVLSVQPEQVANLDYYLPPGLRYTTALGPVPDPRVMNWREALHRLRVTTYHRVVPALVRTMRPGERLLLIAPRFERADSPWTVRLKHLARNWRTRLRHERLLRTLRIIVPQRASTRSSVTVVLFERQSRGAARRYAARATGTRGPSAGRSRSSAGSAPGSAAARTRSSSASY